MVNIGQFLLIIKIISTITGFIFAGIYIWRYSKEPSQTVEEIILFFFSYALSTLISALNQGYIYPNKEAFPGSMYSFYRTFLAFLSFALVVFGNIGLLQFYLEPKYHRKSKQKKIIRWYLVYCTMITIFGSVVIWLTREERHNSGEIYPFYGPIILTALLIPMFIVEVLTVIYAYKQIKTLKNPEFTLLTPLRKNHFIRKYHSIAIGSFFYLIFAVVSSIYVKSDDPSILAILAWIANWISLACFFYGFIWKKREL